MSLNPISYENEIELSDVTVCVHTHTLPQTDDSWTDEWAMYGHVEQMTRNPT